MSLTVIFLLLSFCHSCGNRYFYTNSTYLNNKAGSLRQLKRYTKALEVLKEGIPLAQKQGQKHLLHRMYLHRAICWKETKEKKKAKEAFTYLKQYATEHQDERMLKELKEYGY